MFAINLLIIDWKTLALLCTSHKTVYIRDTQKDEPFSVIRIFNFDEDVNGGSCAKNKNYPQPYSRHMAKQYRHAWRGKVRQFSRNLVIIGPLDCVQHSFASRAHAHQVFFCISFHRRSFPHLPSCTLLDKVSLRVCVINALTCDYSSIGATNAQRKTIRAKVFGGCVGMRLTRTCDFGCIKNCKGFLATCIVGLVIRRCRFWTRWQLIKMIRL